jgi:predicted ferric reductase
MRLTLIIPGSGFIQPDYPAKILWCVVGGFIILLIILNAILYATRTYRVRALQTKYSGGLKCLDSLQVFWSSMTSFLRVGVPSPMLGAFELVHFPTVGDILIISCYLVTVLVLVCVNLEPNDFGNTLQRSLRAACMTVYQLPLVIVLSTRQIALPSLIGVSTERLSIYHRWVARTMLITASIHFGYIRRGTGLTLEDLFFYKPYRFGFAAWIFLIWIVASGLAPIRKLSHDLFVIQHVISVAGFLIMVCIHIPRNVYPVVMPAIGILILNRIITTGRVLWVNKGLMTYSRRDGVATEHYATIRTSQARQSRTTQIQIDFPRISWKPGQHMYLNFPTLGPVETHPFTIQSLPEDGKMVFNVRKVTGFTKRLFESALDSTVLPVILDGPFGHDVEFKQYHSAIFLSGGTGTSYNIPIALDMVRHHRAQTTTMTKERAMNSKGRSIQFMVVVQYFDDLDAYAGQLSEMIQPSPPESGIKVRLSIHVTQDTSRAEFASDVSEEKIEEDRVMEQTMGQDQVTRAQEPGTGASSSTKMENSNPAGVLADREAGLDTTNIANRLQFLQHADIYYGRPQISKILEHAMANSTGLTGLSICAPVSMSVAANNALAGITCKRLFSSEKKLHGVVIHNEAFNL